MLKLVCLLNLKGKELADILEQNAEETIAAPKIKKPTEICRKLHFE
jgi:hypothetical protein